MNQLQCDEELFSDAGMLIVCMGFWFLQLTLQLGHVKVPEPLHLMHVVCPLSIRLAACGQTLFQYASRVYSLYQLSTDIAADLLRTASRSSGPPYSIQLAVAECFVLLALPALV